MRPPGKVESTRRNQPDWRSQRPSSTERLASPWRALSRRSVAWRTPAGATYSPSSEVISAMTMPARLTDTARRFIDTPALRTTTSSLPAASAPSASSAPSSDTTGNTRYSRAGSISAIQIRILLKV